jgi:hypothetical protein
MIRQGRTMRAAAAAWGGGSQDYEEPSYSQRLREKDGRGKEKKYLSPWLVDPAQGGEVTPAYGEGEINVLPINLGYSIIDEEPSTEGGV